MKPAYAFVMLAAGGLGLVSAAAAETKVGLILPYCGTYAALGNNITDGFNFAIEQAGRADNFTILQEDTEVKLSVGLAMPRKLVLEDEVDVLGGIVSSGALRNFVDGAEIPLIVANAATTKRQARPARPSSPACPCPTLKSTGPWAPGSSIRGSRRCIRLHPIMRQVSR